MMDPSLELTYLLYTITDLCFKEDIFSPIDNFLISVDPVNLTKHSIVTILCITYPAKDKLSNRLLFFNKINSTLFEELKHLK